MTFIFPVPKTPGPGSRHAPVHRTIPVLRAAKYACLAACCLFAAALPGAAQAAPLLRCRIDQGGDTRMLDVAPVADPYTVAAVDINGRFRFKAVVIGDATHVDYVKLYVYVHTARQPLLIHQTTYLSPQPGANAYTSPAALTGINQVYSPQLERELQYACALLESAP